MPYSTFFTEKIKTKTKNKTKQKKKPKFFTGVKIST
jgi:hypothetical protein